LPSKTVMEPFRIKSVEPIRSTTRQELLRAPRTITCFCSRRMTCSSICLPPQARERCQPGHGLASWKATRALPRAADSITFATPSGTSLVTARHSPAPGPCSGAHLLQRDVPEERHGAQRTHLDTTRLGGRGNVPRGAIGSVEIGTLMFRAAATRDLVRFAIPRRRAHAKPC
jgi:hypothetical protein